MSSPANATPLHTWPILLVAVLAISTSAVIVSSLDSVHPVTIALWRTTIVAVVLSPWVRWPARGDLLRIAIAGVCLAAHFGTWFASLQLTTVLRSTVLVCLAPVWTGLAEWLIKGEAPRLRWWIGVAIAVPAAAIMGAVPEEGGSLLGDGLAVLGGLLGAVYFLLGREVRGRVSIGTYGSLVCVAAAAALLPTVLLLQAPILHVDPWIWAAFAGLALGPQMLGHNGFNYALRYLPASTVTTATLLEPVGAGLLAWWILDQVPTIGAAVAGTVAIGGVILAALPSPDPGQSTT